MNPEIQCPAINGYEVVQHPSGACIATPDWIWIATQTGRLDLVTALLAILGVMLGMFALFSFAYISGRSAEISRRAAREAAEQEVPSAVEASLPGQLSEALSFHLESAISRFDPDKVAQAVEEQENTIQESEDQEGQNKGDDDGQG